MSMISKSNRIICTIGTIPVWTSLVLASLILLSDSIRSEEPPVPSTFCNPISIPNYPIGRFARDLIKGDHGPEWMWRLGRRLQFRELADVTALWFDDKWYLYPSVDMAWVSGDRGATWKHHPLNIRDIGYAPTIVHHQGKFLLMASDSSIYVSENPQSEPGGLDDRLSRVCTCGWESSSPRRTRLAQRHGPCRVRVHCLWKHQVTTSSTLTVYYFIPSMGHQRLQ